MSTHDTLCGEKSREGPRAGGPPHAGRALFIILFLFPLHTTLHQVQMVSRMEACDRATSSTDTARRLQDLLTQPLIHHHSGATASRSPPAQSPSNVAPATEQEGGASIGKHVSTDSQASIESTTEHRQQEAEQFAQLRTAPALDTTGLEHEPRIVAPSHANGDWRVYGRVKAQCIFWHEGTLQEKGLGIAWKKSREKLDQVHEWVADGTLWITKVRGVCALILSGRFCD